MILDFKEDEIKTYEFNFKNGKGIKIDNILLKLILYLKLNEIIQKMVLFKILLNHLMV